MWHKYEEKDGFLDQSQEIIEIPQIYDLEEEEDPLMMKIHMLLFMIIAEHKVNEQ